MLALVAGQDVVPVEGSDGTDRALADSDWRIARQVAPERVISTVDPEARHAHKTRARHQDGYKAHVKVEPDTGLITGCALTPAAGRSTPTPRSASSCWPTNPPRSRCWAIRPTAPASCSPRPQTWGHTAIIKPWPLRPAVRSISWLVAGRNRRLRFVGARRNDLWLHHRVAALNLRRLLALGLTRSGGS